MISNPLPKHLELISSLFASNSFTDIYKIGKQTSWQIIAKIFTALSTLIILSFVSRTYGETGTGSYTLALAYLGFFYLAVDLGLNAYILPRLPIYPQDANSLFNARVLWSFILIIVANLLSFILPFSDPIFRILVLIGSISIFSDAFILTANLIFQRDLKYEYSLASISLGALINLLTIICLCLIRAPLEILILGTVFSGIVTALMAFSLIKPLYKFNLNLSQGTFALQILKHAWPMALTLAFNTIYFRVDAFILSTLYPMSVVGVYNLAYQIFQMALVLPTYIMNSFYPLMIQDLKLGYKIFFQKSFIMACGLFVISIFGVIFIWVFASPLISLITSDSFSGSAEALKILSLSFPAFFLTSLLMMIFIASGKYIAMAAVYGFGLAINLILNLVWIPQFSFYAASWVTVIAEYAILILELVIVIPWIYQNLKEESENQL